MWSSPQEANRHIETGGFTSERILLFISNLSLLTNGEEGRIGRVTLLEIWFTVEGSDDDVSEGRVEECNPEGKLKEKGINIEDGVHANFSTVEPWQYKVSTVPNKSAKKTIDITHFWSCSKNPWWTIKGNDRCPGERGKSVQTGTLHCQNSKERKRESEKEWE